MNTSLIRSEVMRKICKNAKEIAIAWAVFAVFVALAFAYESFIGPEIVEPAWYAISGFFKSIGTTALLWGIFIGVVIIGLK